jgi:hypothetical protein
VRIARKSGTTISRLPAGLVCGSEQHQRQVPYAVQEADKRRCHVGVAAGQLRQHVTTPADLLEEGEERDDDKVDGEVDRGVRFELPGHHTDQSRSGVRRDQHGGRSEQGQRPVAPAARCRPSSAQPALRYPSGVMTRSISSTPAVTVSMLRIWICGAPSALRWLRPVLPKQPRPVHCGETQLTNRHMSPRFHRLFDQRRNHPPDVEQPLAFCASEGQLERSWLVDGYVP